MITLSILNTVVLIFVLCLLIYILYKNKNKTDLSKTLSEETFPQALQQLSSIRDEQRSLMEKQIYLESSFVQKIDFLKEHNKILISEVFETKFSGFQNQIHLFLERQNKNSQEFKDSFLKFQEEKFFHLNQNIDQHLTRIMDKVRENLDEGFKKTNETFQSLIERLAKIDEAQKKIESLSMNVVSLQDVLTDKKSRGIFGEVQLNGVLSAIFGEKNDKVYALQYKLKTGVICDSILFLPEPTGKIVVDSKFPLENFRRMFDQNYTEIERKEFTKEFRNNLKKHIDDISSKYIIPGETADQALLFLPAEAVFSELHAYHGEIIEYAQSKKVWICSPTTFMAMMTTVQVVLNNIERSKYTNVIHQELNRLGEEFLRYKKRWDSLSTHMDTVAKDVKDIHTTTEKISNRFQQISEVKIDFNSVNNATEIL